MTVGANTANLLNLMLIICLALSGYKVGVASQKETGVTSFITAVVSAAGLWFFNFYHN